MPRRNLQPLPFERYRLATPPLRFTSSASALSYVSTSSDGSPVPLQLRRQAVVAAPLGEYWVVSAGADLATLVEAGFMELRP